MVVIHKKEAEALETYHLHWESYFSEDYDTYASTLDDIFEFIGMFKAELSHGKEDRLLTFHNQLMEDHDKTQLQNRKINSIPVDDLVLVDEEADLCFLEDGVWTFYSSIRISSVLRETPYGWKIVQQHQSIPQEKSQASKRLAEENFQLREALSRSTEQLKNNEQEIEIVRALERVREVAMNLQSLQDLTSLSEIIFFELKGLGFPYLRNTEAVIDLPDLESICSYHYFGDGHKGAITVDCNINPTLQKWVKHLKKIENTFAYVEIKGEELQSWIKFQKKIGYQRETFLGQVDSIYYYSFSTDLGALSVSTWNPIPIELLPILERFKNVFEIAYKRYSDVTKAEKQTKEAQIEAALERVRARSMAMRRSEELQEVVNAVFDNLLQLDVVTDTVTILIPKAYSKDIEVWIQNKEHNYSSKLLIPYYESSQIGRDLVKAREEKSELFTHHYSKEEKDKWFLHLFNHPESLINIPKERKEYVLGGPSYCISSAFNTHTGMYMGRYYGHPFSASENDILIRFARVFEQTYTRFLDLQKAENQTKEAIKQASLDRLRADIASMRTADDLNRITPLIWKELTSMGISFIRCGVFIMDDQKTKFHTYLSTPDGQAIAAFDLAYSKARNLKEVFHHWTEGNSYVTRWMDEDFQIQADTLIEEGVIKTKEQYLQNIPKEGIYLHFLPFLKGMLYVGNPSPLKEEELQLVQALADTFSTAYARYMDFVKLETAKLQVERTLRDLKLTQQQLIQSEKMASLGELTAGIAHEIQNPLNFVNNFSELSEELLDEMVEEIEKGNLNEVKALSQELKDNLSKINHHGKRAGSIIKGMLEHSRKSESKKEPADLNALAEECLKLSFHGLRAKDKSFHANFSCNLEPNIPTIQVVRQEIGRVLLNLINNAFYAVNEKAKTSGPYYSPEVIVRTRYQEPELGKDARIELSIIDNGKGIPSKIKSKIFQPFFTTKPSGQGTGLGLSISYDIIKGHGGELSVETEENKGSTFLISLPFPN